MIAAEKLKAIQRYSQFFAFLVLIIFVALIGYSVMKLQSINAEINEAQASRERIKAENDTLRTENVELEKRNEALRIAQINLSQYGTNITEKLAETDPAEAKELAKTSPDIARSFVPTVHIQPYNQEQKVRVAQIAEVLKRDGYLIPVIEPHANKVKATEVFYFHEEDLPEAKKLAALLQEQGVLDAEAKPAPEKYFGTVRPRKYEIWFSSQAF